MSRNPELDKLINSFHSPWTKSVCVITGAGISKASGIPTFRDPGGIWENIKVLEAHHIRKLPDSLPIIWDTWKSLISQLPVIKPNLAHYILADLGQLKQIQICTQNVDGLHQLAGSKIVYELHGSIYKAQCMKCNKKLQTLDLNGNYECTVCKGPVRPCMTLFGEDLPTTAWNNTLKAVKHCDIFLAIGTSGEVYPVSELVTLAKREAGALTCLINAEPWKYPNPDFNMTIIGKAEEILPRLL